MDATTCRYRTGEECFSFFKEQMPLMFPGLLKRIPRQAHLPPPEVLPPIVQLKFEPLCFRIVEDPNHICLEWARKTREFSDGYIPLIMIRLVDDFNPFTFNRGGGDLLAWIGSVRFLRDTFGQQFSFMFQVGKHGPRKYYPPLRIWLNGNLSEEKDRVVRPQKYVDCPIKSIRLHNPTSVHTNLSRQLSYLGTLCPKKPAVQDLPPQPVSFIQDAMYISPYKSIASPSDDHSPESFLSSLTTHTSEAAGNGTQDDTVSTEPRTWPPHSWDDTSDTDSDLEPDRAKVIGGPNARQFIPPHTDPTWSDDEELIPSIERESVDYGETGEGQNVDDFEEREEDDGGDESAEPMVKLPSLYEVISK
ncbi:hypothetical protein F5Y14DRAFT_462531 [Nemania sp. NC0429]|nr:hypothetical protein F5Y14DRAFT_462531 [Nemania sp. NC0429]